MRNEKPLFLHPVTDFACHFKELVRKYPKLQYVWEDSGLQQACDHLTFADRCFEIERNENTGDFRDAWNYSKALQFGKNEVYRRRKA